MDKEQSNKICKFIFEVVERTKVSMIDMARITNVSRTTMYRWRDGENITDEFRLNYVYQISLRMNKAYQIGKLPLKNKFKKDERIKVLKQIISETSPN